MVLVNDKSKANKNILKEDDVRIENIDGKRIIVINVPRASRKDRPIYVDDDINTGTYRRNGEGDYKCTSEEIAGMLRDASSVTHDKRVISSMTTEIFDKKSIKAYSFLVGSKVNLLRIGAVKHDKKGVLRPTVAGLLMFGKTEEIFKEVPNFFLDYQERMSEDSEITNRVVGLNIFDFYNKVSKMIDDNIDTELKLLARVSLINSLTNSDYYGTRGFIVIKSKVQINISNPGSFRMDVEYAKIEESMEPRNALLMNMLKLIGKANNTELLYSFRDNLRTVVSYNPDRTVTTIFLDNSMEVTAEDMLREKVISYLTNNIKADRRELLDEFNSDIDGLILVICELEDEELIVSDDKGQYTLNDH